MCLTSPHKKKSNGVLCQVITEAKVLALHIESIIQETLIINHEHNVSSEVEHCPAEIK